MFSCRQLSVISISSRLGGKFASTSSLSSFWANHGSRSWIGEMLTDSVSCGSHALASCSAWRDHAFRQIGDHADFLGDRNEDVGLTMPNAASSSARASRSRPARRFRDRSAVRNRARTRRAECPGECRFRARCAEAQFALHLRFEPEVAVPALLLGVVHGDVGHVHQRLARRARRSPSSLAPSVRAMPSETVVSMTQCQSADDRLGRRPRSRRGEPVDLLGPCASSKRNHAGEFVAADAGQHRADRA